ncbi:RNA 2'-phosphotransferase [Paenibacillus sp. NPDC057967]|uniref:RNA 2'-phosphotransferase n=1 Tax=Paenibacillus sp. NPDC057967 TaxID=3346293 RepID=UPI0036DE5678
MLDPHKEKSLSKLISKMLRHTPEAFGLVLAPEDGSCTLDALLASIQAQPKWGWVAKEHIELVVRQSEKQRFEIIDARIRARYGHSHDRVSYSPAEPPAILYHGTNKKALTLIMNDGLKPMSRQYVHLSEGTDFAALAGSRRGELVILEVDTCSARQSGVTFYYAGNEVWLADHVPAVSFKLTNPENKEK